jgi:hypothetical protein
MHTIMCTLSHAHTVNPQKKSIVFGGLQNWNLRMKQNVIQLVREIPTGQTAK